MTTPKASDEDRYTYTVRNEITDAEMSRWPPGPKRQPWPVWLFSDVIWPWRTAQKRAVAALEYGDIASFWVGPQAVFQINSPDLVKEVFVDNYRDLRRGRLEAVRWVLGTGLVVSNPPEHREHRRMMQPEFHRHRVAMYCAAMADSVENHVSAWQDGERVEFLRSMAMLGTDVTAKTLFGMDWTAQTGQMTKELEAAIKYLFMRELQHPLWRRLAHKLPLPSSLAFKKALARLDGMMYDLINERRTTNRIHDDFISVVIQQQQRPGETFDIYDLMAAESLGRLETPAPGQGQCPVDHSVLNDKQLRDEAITFLIAGQESYHIAMSWIMHYLSIHPEYQERLHQEVDTVLEGRRADIADFPRFEFIDRLIYEGMRIHSPFLGLGRIPAKDITVGGYTLPQGMTVLVPIYLIHRLPKYYSEPEKFNPDRWTPEFREQLHPFAYMPFGIGAHRCIGEQFAWMQLRLTLAAIGQRWWVRPDPRHKVALEPSFFSLPKGGMPLYLEARK